MCASKLSITFLPHNFSYSRQNLLSNNCKSNENVCVQQQHQQHLINQAVASSQPQQSAQYSGGRNATSSSTLHHVHHNILPVMDNKYFMHFRNQIHQARSGDETANANPPNDYDSPNTYNSSSMAVNFSSEPVFDEQLPDQQQQRSISNDASMVELGQAQDAAVNDVNYVTNDPNKHNPSRPIQGVLRSNRCTTDSELRTGIEASGFSRDRNMSNSNRLTSK